MAEKSLLIMPFPILGLDRSVAFQRQPPHTTPDALNVRPESVAEGRERGGSRPALAPAFRQDLSVGIDMLAQVDIVDTSTFAYEVDDFESEALSTKWSFPPWSSLPKMQVVDGMAVGDINSGLVRAVSSINTAKEYVLEIFIVPWRHAHHGTYLIWFRMNDVPDVTDVGMTAKLVLNTNGDFSGSLIETGGSTYSFAAGTTGYPAAGWFTVVIHADNKVSCYWRRHTLLANQSVLDYANKRAWGFGVEPIPGGICQVNRARMQYYQLATSTIAQKRSRRSLLVLAAGGEIYAEDWMGSFKKVVGTAQNEKQLVTVAGALGGGDFILSFNGSSTSPLLSTATAAQVDAALEALPTIGVGNVAVTGADGGPWTVEFVGALGGTDQPLMTSDESNIVITIIQDGMANSAPSVATGVPLTAAQHNQLLYIADYSDPIVSGTDLQIAPNQLTMTSASVGNWALAGLTTSHGFRVKGTGKNQIYRIELTKCTTGQFKLFCPPKINDNESVSIAYNASTAAVQAAIEGIKVIGSGNVTVTGTPGQFYDVQFTGALANKHIGPITPFDVEVDGVIAIEKRQEGTKGTDTSTHISGIATTQVFAPQIVQTPGGETQFNFTAERVPKVFDPKVNTLKKWHADTAKGFVPIGCEIITVYRDRMVLAGDPEAPHLWYMSRQGDPYDWDYSQDDAGAAVYGQSSLAGRIAQPITALMTTTDECLIFGCTSSLWILRGDAAHGGQIDNLSFRVGVVSPTSWCYAPGHMLYFLSDIGLYRMRGDCGATEPESVSREKLPRELLHAQRQLERIFMAYDHAAHGIHIFMVRNVGAPSLQWFFDLETQSFWPQQLQANHEPLSVLEYQAQDPLDNQILLGGVDGVVRGFSANDDQDDDGNLINSFIDLGPFDLTKEHHESIVQQLRGIPGQDSEVSWGLRVGPSEEEAFLQSIELAAGKWQAGMNSTSRPRIRSAAMVLSLSGIGGHAWSFERAMAVLRSAGVQRL
jgi:hypothetical protein